METEKSSLILFSEYIVTPEILGGNGYWVGKVALAISLRSIQKMPKLAIMKCIPLTSARCICSLINDVSVYGDVSLKAQFSITTRPFQVL